MKIDRLIGILSLLLQKDTVTAPDLAAQFEVSRRTINRDIEDLCKAGIPVVTRQGAGGGISIMENYKIEKTLLTNAEMQDILAGLRGLDSVNGTNRYGQLMEKLSAGSSDFMVGSQSVLIDLSSWYKDSLAPKIELIQDAIGRSLEIRFLYFSPKGEQERCIEPYYLIFRWSSWYVWGWCRSREDFRLFKLNRMEKLQLSEGFTKRPVPLPDLSNERIFPGGIRVKALIDRDCKWRLVEEFGPESFEVLPDGMLLFCSDFYDRQSVIGWIASFGGGAELLEPAELRQAVLGFAEGICQKYRPSTET